MGHIEKKSVFSRSENNHLFYDISNSTIDEYILLNALFGSEQLKLIFDKKEGGVKRL